LAAILPSRDVSPRPFAVILSLVAGNRTGSARQESRWDAEPIDVPRYAASLRRGKGLIAAIVVSMTAAVFVISMWLPKTYEASARIVMDDRPGGAEPADAETVRRRLATVRALITTREIRVRAAARLEGESVVTLKDKVHATVDADANIVDVHTVDNEPEGAAAIANTVAREFVAMQRASERLRLARARAALERALARASSPQSAEADAIRQRLSEIRLAEAAGGPELVLAEPAQPPPTASSPRPVRNAIFAFFASVFLAVLAALGLGQLAPRVAGARDLGLLTGMPVVADVPRARRPNERAREAAYQELQTALSLRLPTASKIIVVCGAHSVDAVSSVAVGLARTLAQTGHTLLLSADLWRPRVHDALELQRSPGLAELLSGSDGEVSLAALERVTHTIEVDDEALDVVTAGGPVRNAAGVLAKESFSGLILELERSDYRHVVVEGPGLLGSVHGQLVARYADAMLVVCEPERLSPADAVELGEFLRALEPPFAGLVTVGGRSTGGLPAVSAPQPRERAQADV
jgi:Mrp family chromosome partitioning ATPase